MNKNQRIIIAFVGAIIVAAAWAAFSRGRGAKDRELTGTVLSISPATRIAAMEYVHPKNGNKYTLSAQIPMNCEIVVNGRPSQLSDIHAGDVVTATGTIDNEKKILAKRVRVERPAEATSAPAATQPAGTR
jgi:hypothetical protein